MKLWWKRYWMLAFVLLAVMTLWYQHVHIQKIYAKEVVRFHVIANSDEAKDQELKLLVRDRVGAYVNELLKGAKDKKETIDILEEHKEKICQVAKKELERNGCMEGVRVSIEQVEFPVKYYGKYHLPAGQYTSLQIRIGEAKGANWWCVAYPNMCFLNSVYEVTDEMEDGQLYQVFTLYEYKKLIESPNKEFKSKLLDVVEKTCASR